MAHQASNTDALCQQLFDITKENLYLENPNLAEDEIHKLWTNEALRLASVLGVSISKKGNRELSKRTSSSPMMKSKSVCDSNSHSINDLSDGRLGAAPISKTDLRVEAWHQIQMTTITPPRVRYAVTISRVSILHQVRISTIGHRRHHPKATYLFIHESYGIARQLQRQSSTGGWISNRTHHPLSTRPQTDQPLIVMRWIR